MSDDVESVPVPAVVASRTLTKPATIYDVARMADVSHQTVSRYLKGYEGIRPATRERVEVALKSLDYRMNLTARSLRTRQSHRVIALAANLDQVGPSRTVQGAIEGARDAGYLLDVVFVDVADRASVAEAIALVSRQDVAGILALNSTDEMADAFAGGNITAPLFVSMETDDPGGTQAGLHSDGMIAVVDHLADLGHRRFFHIGGPLTWVSARNRLAAYERTLDARGLQSIGAEHGDWSPQSGYSVVMHLPDLADVTALVVANDQMALGAILALEERGWRVPDHISVVGFDDIPEAAFFRPPLTTVAQDFNSQGRVAFENLRRLMEDPAAPVPQAATVRLMVRRSSGPVAR